MTRLTTHTKASEVKREVRMDLDRVSTPAAVQSSDRDLFDSWTQMEQRMAFYAGIYKNGTFLILRDLAVEWREALANAMQIEYRRVDAGILPRRLTPFVVLGKGPGPCNGTPDG